MCAYSLTTLTQKCIKPCLLSSMLGWRHYSWKKMPVHLAMFYFSNSYYSNQSHRNVLVSHESGFKAPSVCFWYSFLMLYAKSCVWLFVTPWTIACQAPLPIVFFQARILEWVAISFSRGFSQPRDLIYFSCISCFGRHIPYH